METSQTIESEDINQLCYLETYHPAQKNAKPKRRICIDQFGQAQAFVGNLYAKCFGSDLAAASKWVKDGLF